MSRMPPPLPDIPTTDRPEGLEETLISRTPPSPAYEPPPPPPIYSPEGEKGGRNTMVIVAVVLILLCCCCLAAILGGYMLTDTGILDEFLREISLAFSLV